MHRGYIKIWRKTLDSGLIQMPNALALFVYMLMEATHKPIRYGTVELERGQLVTGRHKLSSELNMSEQTVRTCLAHLEKFDFITSKSTNKFTVYTIVNYSKYQDADSLPNQQDNQQVTNEQPTANQQLTTIQEHKHIRTKEHKISKRKSKTSIPDDFEPTQEHGEYAGINNLSLSEELINFRLYHEKEASTSGNWNSSFSLWLRNAVKFRKPKYQSRSDRDKEIADQLTGRSNATTFLD